VSYRPLTFLLSLVDTAESESLSARSANQSQSSPSCDEKTEVELTYESEDFCFALPVKARRAAAQERLLSY